MNLSIGFHASQDLPLAHRASLLLVLPEPVAEARAYLQRGARPRVGTGAWPDQGVAA
jgi:hypothetical protein